jgi:methyl-accepting chemotaxis protein
MKKRLTVLRRLDNIHITSKLVGSFLIGSFVGVAIGLVGLVQISRVNEGMQELSKRHMRAITNIHVLGTRFQDLRADLLLMTSMPPGSERNAVETRAMQRRPKIESTLADIERDLLTQEERDAWEALSDGVKSFSSHLEQVVELVHRKKNRNVQALLAGGIESAKNQIQGNLDRMYEITTQRADEAAARGEANATSARWLIGILIVCGTSAALLWGLYAARAIVRPVRTVVRAIESADLHSRFDVDRKDEIGELQHSLNSFLETIRNTVTEVAQIAGSIARAANDITVSTDAMAVGADEQSKQATDVSASVEEMSKTILENSRNANVTAASARSAKDAAVHGGSVVQETISGMKRIADVVKESADGVKMLGASSDQIGRIVLVIEEIADQTNLLALNAAIEAARAGDQGRGFAVVADEVRKLAERTTEATKEIAEMIRRIQNDTAAAVRSMDLGTEQVTNGIALADAAGKSLNEIVEVSQTVTDMIVHIASASEQQASTSEAIAQSVVQISTVTQTSAAGIQQIVRTVDDLNQLTDALQNIIARFRLSTEVSSSEEGSVRHHTTQGAGHPRRLLRGAQKADDAVSRAYVTT